MKTFKDFTVNYNQQLDIEDNTTLNENFLKTASKLVLFNKVRTLSGQVKKEKNTAKKLDLIASQNTHIAALFLIKD